MQTNWKLVSLADFSTKEKNSFVNGPFGSDLLSSELVDEGYPVIYIKDLTNGRYQKKSSYYVTEQKYNSLSACQVAYGDVLISKVGSPPCEAAIYDCKIPAIVTQDVIRIKTSSLHASQFLAQLLNSDFGRKKINTIKITGTRERVSLTDLKKVKFPLPPDDIQQKIAKILSTWDKAITNTENLIANSEMQKKALMQQLLTGKKRLLDKNGVRFSGEWFETTLNTVADVYQPKTISQSHLTTSGYPVYGANGIIGFYHEFNHETEQIAITCRGSTCGTVNLTQEKSWITGNAMVINTDQLDIVDKKFLYYLLDNTNFSYLISGSGQPQITGNIKNHIIYIPTKDEQEKIAEVLSNADREIELLQAKLEHLKQEKKALMQQLLTGKRRVVIN